MTLKAFVLGWPIAHSRSPLIHRFWLKRHGIDGDYVREPVRSEELSSFLAEFGEHGYVGGNVTLPHKEAAFQACASTTEIARRLGAVNTLWREGGKLCGDNTDAYGFAANLDELAPKWRNGGTALVLGAGGASRAVLQALVEVQFNSIVVMNRTRTRAESLARHFGPPVSFDGLERLPAVMRTADIIVNTTSAGLHGEAGLDIPWTAAKKGAIATDLVYVPLVTPFLAGAREHGLKIVDGLGMLLHQAVPGFERWFGVRPRVDADLRAHLVADLKA